IGRDRQRNPFAIPEIVGGFVHHALAAIEGGLLHNAPGSCERAGIFVRRPPFRQPKALELARGHSPKGLARPPPHEIITVRVIGITPQDGQLRLESCRTDVTPSRHATAAASLVPDPRNLLEVGRRYGLLELGKTHLPSIDRFQIPWKSVSAHL